MIKIDQMILTMFKFNQDNLFVKHVVCLYLILEFFLKEIEQFLNNLLLNLISLCLNLIKVKKNIIITKSFDVPL